MSFQLSFLSRVQFNQACDAFIREQSDAPLLHTLAPRDRQPWRWQTHPSVPNLGCMARSTSAFRRNSCKPPAPLAEEIMVDEAEDESTLGISPTPDAEIVAVQQYIVYSPTFGVPVLYFTIQDQHGAFLPLQEIVKTSLFRSDVLPENTTTESHAIVMESSQFPLLSFGDHPVLGMACWYFHPCETARAVNEILEAGKEEAPDEHQERPERDLLLKWIEAWFLVLGTTVDLR